MPSGTAIFVNFHESQSQCRCPGLPLFHELCVLRFNPLSWSIFQRVSGFHQKPWTSCGTSMKLPRHTILCRFYSFAVTETCDKFT